MEKMKQIDALCEASLKKTDDRVKLSKAEKEVFRIAFREGISAGIEMLSAELQAKETK